ncbi:unknown [Prevotella sp. CAG:1124]|nr:unknown [Prevotella sp. CAG:1124]
MFPEKIEFDGKNIEPNPTTRCLTLSISKPMSYEETKKKKEKDFRLSPIQYPEPVHYRKIKRKQKNLKVLIINIL